MKLGASFRFHLIHNRIEEPRIQVQSKNPQTHPGASISDRCRRKRWITEGGERGELKINLSIPNPNHRVSSMLKPHSQLVKTIAISYFGNIYLNIQVSNAEDEKIGQCQSQVHATRRQSIRRRQLRFRLTSRRMKFNSSQSTFPFLVLDSSIMW